MSDRTTKEVSPSPYLQKLVAELSDFARLVRLTRMWEIGWVAENGEGDPTAFERLRARLQQMLPSDYELSDEEASPRVLEEAITAAYRNSATFDQGRIILVVTEPTLFGQVKVESLVEKIEAAIEIIVLGADGAELERTVLGPDFLGYGDLSELLEDVADELCE